MSTLNEKIKWAETQEWAKKMMLCEQNPQWHLEGNVWKHTLMVCEELEKLEEYKFSSEHDKQILQWSALLHDVAKPVTTVIEDGKISTRHHGSTGAVMVRIILSDLGTLNVIDREEICSLIQYHMSPPQIGDAEDSAYYVIKTSWLCKNNLLYILSLADVKGRLSKEKNTIEDSISWVNMWSDECCKFKCFIAPYEFVNEQARFMFYLKKNFQPYYKPYTGDMFDVYMICGLPGTGKTTFAKKLGLPVVEMDMAREELGVDPLEDEGRVHQLTKEMCREQMRKKQPFVFAGVNHIKMNRQKWIGLFFAYGARIRIKYLERPLEIVMKQNKERDKKVPEHVIMNMRSRLEVPNWDECHDFEIVSF